MNTRLLITALATLLFAACNSQADSSGPTATPLPEGWQHFEESHFQIDMPETFLGSNGTNGVDQLDELYRNSDFEAAVADQITADGPFLFIAADALLANSTGTLTHAYVAYYEDFEISVRQPIDLYSSWRAKFWPVSRAFLLEETILSYTDLGAARYISGIVTEENSSLSEETAQLEDFSQLGVLYFQEDSQGYWVVGFITPAEEVETRLPMFDRIFRSFRPVD